MAMLCLVTPMAGCEDPVRIDSAQFYSPTPEACMKAVTAFFADSRFTSEDIMTPWWQPERKPAVPRMCTGFTPPKDDQTKLRTVAFEAGGPDRPGRVAFFYVRGSTPLPAEMQLQERFSKVLVQHCGRVDEWTTP